MGFLKQWKRILNRKDRLYLNEVIVITGAGGVLCSAFAKEMAGTGAPVALLDLNLKAAEAVAEEIRLAGGRASAYRTNVLDKANLEQVHREILRDLGKCRVLINGAGGNNPRCTTEHEIFEAGDESAEDIKTFFNLDKEGFDFVFSLNMMGSFAADPGFCKGYAGRGRLLCDKCVVNECLPPAYEDSGLQCGQGSRVQFYTVAGRSFCSSGYSGECNRAGIFCYKPKQSAFI